MKNKKHSDLFKEYRAVVDLHNKYFNIYINEGSLVAKSNFTYLYFTLRKYKMKIYSANADYQRELLNK